MSRWSSTFRALGFAGVGLILSTVGELLKHVFLPNISIWQSHASTIAFCTFLAFFLSRWVIRREQGFLDTIKAHEDFSDTVIQQLPALLCILRPDGSLLRWNPQVETKLGYSRHTLSKINILDALREEDREQARQKLEAVVNLNVAETDGYLLHRDGTKIPLSFTGKSIVFRGEPCILGIAVEISEKKRVRDQLRLQAAALRAAANGIVITGRDGNIEWVNPAFTAMTGFTREEVIGKNPRLLKSGRHGKEFYDNLWSTISSGKVWRGEMANCRKDGTQYTEEMTITPVSSRHGQITHYIAIKQDISARKLAEDALRRAEERFREIFDQAVTGIFQSSPQGHFLMMNPAMARMLRQSSPAQALAEINDIGVLYGDRAKRRELLARLEANGTLHFEHEFSGKDGTALWLSLNLRCIYNDDGSVAYYEGTAEDITTRMQAEKALQESEERLRLFVEHAPVALAMFDREMRYLSVSRRWLANHGLDRDLHGVSHYDVFPSVPERWKQAHRRGLAGEVVGEDEDRVELANGSVQWTRWVVRPWYETARKVGGIVLFTEDITERKRLESELQQAQKMEAVGRLAGGVAHDFNNMLGVITGYSDLLKLRTDLDEKAVHQIEQIHTAATKAASVTQQLLAFSRKQIIQPRILDLNEVVSKLSNMVRRLVGDDIVLTVSLLCPEARVNADASQIDQIIMNLAVNARDAMPTGGKLMIETDMCELDESHAFDREHVRPGRYVRLTVSDTGCGMDRETMSHLFEPFFTTKELGRGTGLGLSIVYGIVKQSEGYIRAHSEPGSGTSFEIHLPLVEAAAEPVVPARTDEVPTGSEIILLVEDDDAMRNLTTRCLETGGYTVLSAQDGESALRAVREREGPIHLLLTDVVMCGISGHELARSLLLVRPSTRVLYMSGYTADLIAQRGVLEPQVALLEKPFTREVLLRKVRTVLDDGRLAHPAAAF
ncbi:MAG: PAS domain S-box protein [Terriglobales bacterium]